MMLAVRTLDFDYHDRPLLHRISFDLMPGALLHLRGANGSGKSTLLKLIAGLLRPEKGSIEFRGKNIELDLPSYQKQLCFVGHKTGINPYLNPHENCLFDVQYRGDVDSEQLASIFNLQEQWALPCGLLSAGQKRKVGLLRLWFTHASLWLLDEPFVALDDASLAILMEQIKSHQMQGGAVILTSHQALPDEVAMYQEYFL